MLDLLAKNKQIPVERFQEYVQVVHNSTLHLQSVIDDALDLTRLENNKFTIYKELFNIRNAVKDIQDIMTFPIT